MEGPHLTEGAGAGLWAVPRGGGAVRLSGLPSAPAIVSASTALPPATSVGSPLPAPPSPSPPTRAGLQATRASCWRCWWAAATARRSAATWWPNAWAGWRCCTPHACWQSCRWAHAPRMPRQTCLHPASCPALRLLPSPETAAAAGAAPAAGCLLLRQQRRIRSPAAAAGPFAGVRRAANADRCCRVAPAAGARQQRQRARAPVCCGVHQAHGGGQATPGGRRAAGAVWSVGVGGGGVRVGKHMQPRGSSQLSAGGSSVCSKVSRAFLRARHAQMPRALCSACTALGPCRGAWSRSWR